MTFFEVYRAELLRSVAARPSDYMLRAGESPEDYARTTGDKMVAAMRRGQGVGGVDTNSTTFRRTCKRLGIPCTRASMTAKIRADIDSEVTCDS